MKESKNVLVGILAILLGLIVILFPLISVFTINVILGVGIIFLGIWIIIQGLKSGSIAAGIATLLLAIFAIMMGIVFIADIKAFEFFTFFALYVVGFFIILAGFTALLSGKGIKEKSIGSSGIIIGIVLIFIGSYMDNPLVLAAIMGAFLIIAGIMEIFDLFSANEIKELKE